MTRDRTVTSSRINPEASDMSHPRTVRSIYPDVSPPQAVTGCDANVPLRHPHTKDQYRRPVSGD